MLRLQYVSVENNRVFKVTHEDSKLEKPCPGSIMEVNHLQFSMKFMFNKYSTSNVCFAKKKYGYKQYDI